MTGSVSWAVGPGYYITRLRRTRSIILTRNMELHSISKITLRSRDFARTERFYRELFGWKFHQYSETYLGFEPPSGIDGGFQRCDDFSQGDSYLIYIEVEEFETYLQRITDLGGHTTGEIEVVSDTSSYIRIYDPDGNRLALSKNRRIL